MHNQEEPSALATEAVDERRYLPALLAVLALANLSAYLRDSVIAAVFGASGRTDAYFVGSFLPTLLTTILVLESAVPALMPALSRVASDGGATHRFLRGVLAAGAVVLACAVIVTWVAAVPAVHLLAHGWPPGEVLLAASLLRVTAWSLLPLGIGAILAAVLNVHHRYLTAPLGLALMNVIAIGVTLLLSGRLGIYAPAWGMLAGSTVYLLLQIGAVSRLNLKRGPVHVTVPFKSVGRAMFPTLIFSCLAQNVVIVERWLASTLPAGRISYLVYAGKLMMSPLLVITAAGGLLAFVAMSHASTSGDQEAFRASFVRSARVLTILLAMATLALVFLRRPVVELALQHGRFTEHDTEMTAGLLAMYALGLVPNGLAWLLYRSLQSRGRYWEAVRIALLAAAIYLGSALLLFHFWELRGIAAAFPISQTASCLVLYARQPAYLRIPPGRGAHFAGSVVLLCGAVAPALLALRLGIGALPIGPPAAAALMLLGGVAAIVGGLSFGMRLLRVPEGRLFHGWLIAVATGLPRRFGGRSRPTLWGPDP